MPRHLPLACLVLLLTTALAPAAEYLLIASGQSNMAGVAPSKDMPEALRAVPANIVYYHQPDVAKLAPSTTFADGPKYGPIPAFAHALAAARPADTFVILHDAVGGSALCQWVPDYAPAALTAGKIKIGDLYPKLAARLAAVRKAHPAATPLAFLWLQGESDKAPFAAVYGDNLKRLLVNIRRDSGAPALLAVIGEPALADEAVYDQIHAVVADDTHATLVACRALANKQLHFSPKAYEQVGKLFADALLAGGADKKAAKP